MIFSVLAINKRKKIIFAFSRFYGRIFECFREMTRANRLTMRKCTKVEAKFRARGNWPGSSTRYSTISIGIDTCLEISSHEKTEREKERKYPRGLNKEKRNRYEPHHSLSLEPLVNYEYIQIYLYACEYSKADSLDSHRSRVRGAMM